MGGGADSDTGGVLSDMLISSGAKLAAYCSVLMSCSSPGELFARCRFTGLAMRESLFGGSVLIVTSSELSRLGDADFARAAVDGDRRPLALMDFSRLPPLSLTSSAEC